MSESDDRGVAARYLRKLSHGVSGARTGAVEAATMEALSPAHAEEALERAIRTIERESGASVDPASRAEFERLVRDDGALAIERLKREGVRARLTPREEDALEAIVEVDGSRPTLAVSDENHVDAADEGLGQWRGAVKDFAAPISRVASAVGRIDLDGEHKGTGFVVKEGLVLTNRHVLQQIAVQRGPGDWEFRGAPTITFDANPDTNRSRQFAIRSVAFAGRDAINPWRVDYEKLDVAILECEPSGGAAFPAPLLLESDADKIVEGRPIFTIGYPAEPRSGTYQDGLLDRLFRYRYGVKRFAPGEIDRGLGSAAAGTGQTVFAHDATTLGGNSGSCVVDLGNDGQLVVGLHFAGIPKQANYAHANARLRATLTELGLTWKAWIPARQP